MRRSKSKGQPATKWVNQRQEAAIKCFQAGSVFDLLGVRMQMVKAAESICTFEMDLAPQRLADNSNSLRRMGSFEGGKENKEGNQESKRRNSQGKDLKKTVRVGTR